MMDKPEHFIVDRYDVLPVSRTHMTEDNPTDNTVCAVLRDIFKRTDDFDIQLLARVATTMAKKMDKKLREYHYGNSD